MAAPNPEVKEGIRNRRREQSMEGEPLNKDTRDAQQFHTSIYVNATQYGVKTLGIEKGDELLVETHRDRIVIRKPTNE